MKAYFNSKYYSELQRVKSFNSIIIQKMSKDIERFKQEAKEYYEQADPSTLLGKEGFALLNETRDKIRLLKKMVKNMEIQQRLVKLEMHRVVMNYRFDKFLESGDLY